MSHRDRGTAASQGQYAPEVSAALETLEAHGILDPWTIDDILQNEVVPELKAIRSLLDGRPGPDDGVVAPPPPFDRDNLPLGLAGISLETVTEGEEGDARFEINGTRFVAPISTTGRIAPFEPIEIIAEPNMARPRSALLEFDRDVDQLAISADAFNQDVTVVDVTIQPGETETVLETELQEAGLLWAVGTNDQEFSRYQYADGESDILEEPALEPLGLYNDPFEFPQALIARDFIRTEVTRDADASGAADYFSKHQYAEISEGTADRLENAWDERRSD